MQICSVGVYSHSGERRFIDFKLNSLNIITGRSNTGKSTVLDIVEFCLGKKEFTVRSGVVTKSVSWYFAILAFGDERMFVGRPAPRGKSTLDAMVLVGDSTLAAPSYSELRVNSSADVLREEFNSRLGIEEMEIFPSSNSRDRKFHVSARQGFFYSFQSQHEVANPTMMFHRQHEPGVNTTLKATFSYFLGAATVEESSRREQRRVLKRKLAQLTAEREDLDDNIGRQQERFRDLVSDALELGVLDPSREEHEQGEIGEIFDEILNFSPSEDLKAPAERDEPGPVNSERINHLKVRISDLEAQLDLLRDASFDHALGASEYGIQRDRLLAGDIMLGHRDVNPDACVCPLCKSELPEPDDTVDDLRMYLVEVSGRLERVNHRIEMSDHAIRRLESERNELIGELEYAVSRRASRIAASEHSVASQNWRDKVSFLQGRVSQEYGPGVSSGRVRVELDNSRRVVAAELDELEEDIEKDNVVDRLERLLNVISTYLGFYAKQLSLEGADGRISFNPRSLKLYVDSEDGRVPLSRLGGGANWVGYHMSLHLALHRFFREYERPVPRFLMLDQPSQVFFPEDSDDASLDESVDWEAVRAQFRTLYDYVLSSSPGVQLIVTEHANLSEGWFTDCVVENWRETSPGDNALIPDSWLQEVPEY